MKIILILVLFFGSVKCFSQDWRFSGDTLVMATGQQFLEKDQVKIGYGTGTDKQFAYITTSPFSLDGKHGLDRSYANLQMTIKEIRVLKNKRVGDKVFLILKGPAFVNFWCDVVSAIDQGEIKFTKKPD